MKVLQVLTPDGADGWATRTLWINPDGSAQYRIENGWGEVPFSTIDAAETQQILTQYEYWGWKSLDA